MQAEAVQSTEQRLRQHLQPEQMPALRFLRACHSDMQACEGLLDASQGLLCSRSMCAPSKHVTCTLTEFMAPPQQGVLQREGAARPALVCFNLGWMPGQPEGCKEIKTETGTTLEALRQAHEAVADGGSISVVAYTGHEGKWWLGASCPVLNIATRTNADCYPIASCRCFH